MFTFSRLQQLKEELRAQWIPDVEACGVITPEGAVETRKNQAEDPTDRFSFLIEDLQGISATWHTHPASSANLSIGDYWFFMQWSELVHFVVSVDEVRCYVVIQGKVRFIDEAKDHSAWVSQGPLPGEH